MSRVKTKRKVTPFLVDFYSGSAHFRQMKRRNLALIGAAFWVCFSRDSPFEREYQEKLAEKLMGKMRACLDEPKPWDERHLRPIRKILEHAMALKNEPMTKEDFREFDF